MILDLKFVEENGKKILYAYMPKSICIDTNHKSMDKQGHVTISLKEYEWKPVKLEVKK